MSGKYLYFLQDGHSMHSYTSLLEARALKRLEYSRDDPCQDCKDVTGSLFNISDAVVQRVINGKILIKTDDCDEEN